MLAHVHVVSGDIPLTTMVSMDSALGLVGAVTRLHESEKQTNSLLGWGMASDGQYRSFSDSEALLHLTPNLIPSGTAHTHCYHMHIHSLSLGHSQ